MKSTNYFIIRFNDLGEDKKKEIASYFSDIAPEVVEKMLDKAWCEMGVEFDNTETSEDKWRADAYLERNQND